jgi:hypothetical protein
MSAQPDPGQSILIQVEDLVDLRQKIALALRPDDEKEFPRICGKRLPICY